MDKTTKKIVIGASIIVAIGGLVFVSTLISKKIREKNEEKDEKEQEEKEQEEKEEVKKYDPSDDIKALESYIIGWNIITYGDEVDNIVLSLSNEKLKVLNSRWKTKHKQSLWKSLDDEVNGCGTFGFSNCYEASMNRLKSIGL